MIKENLMPLATLVFVIGIFACLSLPGFLKEREEKAWLARYEERVQGSQPLIAEEVEKILADFESEKDSLALVAQEMKNSGIKNISSRFDFVYEIKAAKEGEWGYYENEEINQVFPELWDAISKLDLPYGAIRDDGEYVSFHVHNIEPFYNFRIAFRLMHGDNVQEKEEILSRYVNYDRYEHIDSQWILVWDIHVMRE